MKTQLLIQEGSHSSGKTFRLISKSQNIFILKLKKVKLEHEMNYRFACTNIPRVFTLLRLNYLQIP